MELLAKPAGRHKVLGYIVVVMDNWETEIFADKERAEKEAKKYKCKATVEEIYG